jgi:hypothetical protein
MVTGRTSLTADGKVFEAKLPGAALLVEKVAGKWVVQEAVDELPAAAR